MIPFDGSRERKLSDQFQSLRKKSTVGNEMEDFLKIVILNLFFVAAHF